MLGWLLLAGGAAAIFWFSSERPFGNAKDALLRIVEGLKALTGLSSYNFV